jgi:hypothetical protein
MRTEAHEQAADAVADRVLRVPAPPPVLHGQALAPATRAVLEPRFQHDFSRVRVHTDAAAADSARTLNALAFTSGHDVVLGRDAPSLRSPAGQKLLAHELAHVVQQSTGVAEGIQRKPLVIPHGRTNYRFDNALLTADDLDDEEIVARLRAMSRPELRAYRDRVLDPTVQGFISSLMTAPPLAQVEKSSAIIEQTDVDAIAGTSYWEERTRQAFRVGLSDSGRMGASDEERDAVYAAVWRVRPAAESTNVMKLVTIPPSKERANALLYQFEFEAPKAAGQHPRVTIRFVHEQPGNVAEVAAEPPRGYIAPTLSFTTDLGFPESADVWFRDHPDARRQLAYWLKEQRGSFQGVVVTKSVPEKGPPLTTTFLVQGQRNKLYSFVQLDIELIEGGRPEEAVPPADYRSRQFADLMIHEAQTKVDPRHGDKLGHVNLRGIPADEALSVKVAIVRYWQDVGTRNAEVDAVVPISGTKRTVFYTLRFRADNEVDAERVGEPGATPKLDPNALDVARVRGFEEHSAEPAKLKSWLATRYPDVKPAGTTVEELRQSTNAAMTARATAAEWYETNYKLFVLGGPAAKARLKGVHKLTEAQVPDAEMKSFTPAELKLAELSIQTLTDRIVPMLSNVRLGRQMRTLKPDGTEDAPEGGGKYGGMTFPHASAPTVMIYDAGITTGGLTGFRGGSEGVNLPDVFLITHELGHVVEAKTGARDAFNEFIEREGIGPFTKYAGIYPERESFSEAFGLYQSDPEWLRRNHPSVYVWLDELNRTGKKPEAK